MLGLFDMVAGIVFRMFRCCCDGGETAIRSRSQQKETGRNFRNRYRNRHVSRCGNIKTFWYCRKVETPVKSRNNAVATEKHTTQHRSTWQHGATEVLEGFPLWSQKGSFKMEQQGVQSRNTPETHCFGHVSTDETPIFPESSQVSSFFGLIRTVQAWLRQG